MSNTSDRIAGATQELGGKIEKTVGKVIGNEQMQVEGTIKEVVGKAKGSVSKAAERVKVLAEEVVGAVKKAVAVK